MKLTIVLDQEDDGLWTADVIEIPGVSVSSTSDRVAVLKVQVLALKVIAGRAEHGDLLMPGEIKFTRPKAKK